MSAFVALRRHRRHAGGGGAVSQFLLDIGDGVYMDTSDASSMSQLHNSDVAVTEGDPIGRITNPTGSGVDFTQDESGKRPTLASGGYIEMDETSAQHLTVDLSGLDRTSYYSAFVMKATDALVAIIADGNSPYMLLASAEDTNTQTEKDASAAYTVNGVVVSPENRANLQAAIMTGDDVFIEVTGAATNALWDTLSLFGTSSPTGLTGLVADYVFTATPADGGTVIRNTILAKWPGITYSATLPAPTATGTIPDFSDEEANLPATVSTYAYFKGFNGTYSISGNPSGVTINSTTGVVSIADTTAVQAGTTITVTYTNATGSVGQDFDLTVTASDLAPTFSNVTFVSLMSGNSNDSSAEGNDFTAANVNWKSPDSGAQSFLGSQVGELSASGDFFNIDPWGTSVNFAGDFVMEGWFYPTAEQASQFSALWGSKGLTTAGPDGSMALYRRHDSSEQLALRIVQQDGTGFDVNEDGSTSMALDTWHHVAMNRSGSTLKVFLNGVEEISTTYSGELHSDATTQDFWIGRTSATTQGFLGEVGPQRFAAQSLYTTAFTPPVNPFPLS